MSKKSYSLEDKIQIIKALNDGEYSVCELEAIYNVSNVAIYDWIYKYETYGMEWND